MDASGVQFHTSLSMEDGSRSSIKARHLLDFAASESVEPGSLAEEEYDSRALASAGVADSAALHTEADPHELLLGAHNPLPSDHPALRLNKREWQIWARYALKTMEAQNC